MAKGKRGHNEGSIYRRKDGRWAGAVTTGYDAMGRPKRRTVYGRTRQEVAEKLTELLAKHQRGILTDPTAETVGEYLERWIRDVLKHSARPLTVETYTNRIRKHVIPEVGHLKLSRLTPAHLQALYSKKLDEGLAPATVQYIHAVLHRALGQAVKWNLLARNICDAVSRPNNPRKAMRVLDAEQAARLLEAAREERLYALYVLAITTGLRFGELLGLSWDAVNLEEGRIHVYQQLQWVKQETESVGARQRPVLAEPKSARGRRTVQLPAMAIEALRAHRRMQAQERLTIGPGWGGDCREWNLVFTTEVGTPLNQSNIRNRSFYPLLEKAGLPRIRFHDLRHSAATILLQAGEHPKIVQEMLGHSSISLTLDTYSHVVPTMQKQAAARMQDILTTAQKKQQLAN